MAISPNFDIDEQLEQVAKVPKAVRLAVAPVLLASVAAGYFFVSYQPKMEEFEALNAVVQKFERNLSNIRAVADNLPAFEQEVALLEAEFKRARRRLPEGKHFEDLLSEITTAGKKVGVRIKSIEGQPEIPHDFYAEVPFRIELDGGFHDLARFFERVGKLPRIVNVGEIDIRVDEEVREGTNLRVQGTATTFRFLKKPGNPEAAS